MRSAPFRALCIGMSAASLAISQPALADRAFNLPRGYTWVEVSNCSPPSHLELGAARGGRFDCQFQFTFRDRLFWVFNNWSSGVSVAGHQSILATSDGRGGVYSVGQLETQSGLEPVIFQGSSLRMLAVDLRQGGSAPYGILTLSTNPTTGQFGLTPLGETQPVADAPKPNPSVQAKPWTERAAPNDPMFASIYHAGNFRYRCMRAASAGYHLMNAEDQVIHYKNGTTQKTVRWYWLAHEGPACDPRTGKALNPNEEYIYPWGIGRTGP